MAQAQAQRTATQFVTKEQSLLLVKNLLKVSLAEVCYIRNIFPSEAFEKVMFGTTEVNVLSNRGGLNEEAGKLKQMEEAAFDALQKGYLKSIIFGIYQKVAGSAQLELLESYVYQVKYPSDSEVEMTLKSDKGSFALPRVRDEAVTLVRTLIRLAETFPRPVPEDRLVNLTLYYYDDRTPEDYQPPGFVDATHEANPSFEPTMKATLGRVSSKHHSLTMKVAAAVEDDGMMADFTDSYSQRTSVDAASSAAASASVSQPRPAAPLVMLAQAAATSSASAAGTSAQGVQAKAKAPVPAKTAATAPAGVDPGAYVVCRRAVAVSRKASVKFVLDVCCSSGVDVGNEQAKRLMRAMEAEGLLVQKGLPGAFKFEVVTAAAVALLTAEDEAAVARAEGRKNDSGSTADPALGAADVAKVKALLWYTRAVVAVLGRSTTRPFVTLSELQADAGGVDGQVVERLARKLEKDGYLMPPGANGAHANKGRRVVTGNNTADLLKKAVTQLQSLGEPVPSYALAPFPFQPAAPAPAPVRSAVAVTTGVKRGASSMDVHRPKAPGHGAAPSGSAIKKPRVDALVHSKQAVSSTEAPVVHFTLVSAPVHAGWDDVVADERGEGTQAQQGTSARGKAVPGGSALKSALGKR